MTTPHEWAAHHVATRRSRGTMPTPKDILKALGSQPLDHAEVLRRVAVELELDGDLRQPIGPPRWRGLRTLYQAAFAADPTNPEVLLSWAYSARTTVAFASESTSAKDREAIRVESLTVARRAIAAHDLARAHYALGLAHYEGESDELEHALAAFTAANERDPSDPWSRLYRAHCLQDLERWEDAATAYATVSPDDFDADRAWRGWAARERQAECLLHGGHRDEAIAAYAQVLDAYEAARGTTEDEDDLYEPDLLDDEDILDTLPELAERVAALTA